MANDKPFTVEEQIDTMKKYVTFTKRARMRDFLQYSGYFRASRYGKYLLSYTNVFAMKPSQDVLFALYQFDFELRKVMYEACAKAEIQIKSAIANAVSLKTGRKVVAPIDKAEASKVLAQYLADVVQKGLDNVLDNGGDIFTQIGLANKIVDLIQNTTQEADFATLSVDQRAEQLLALLREQDPRLAVGKTAADLNTQERMMACVDIYQALTESRPYKQGMSHEKACGILKDMADKGWLDADIVSKVDSCFRT